jgi:D-alanine--poly(phosphoribitol) ligase subunit 2
MAVGSTTVDRLRLLISDALSIEVPATDADLIDSGLLDSLALVTMIVEIEQEFQVELPLDDFDVDRFRSVNRIAEFLAEVDPGTR